MKIINEIKPNFLVAHEGDLCYFGMGDTVKIMAYMGANHYADIIGDIVGIARDYVFVKQKYRANPPVEIAKCNIKNIEFYEEINSQMINSDGDIF